MTNKTYLPILRYYMAYLTSVKKSFHGGESNGGEKHLQILR